MRSSASHPAGPHSWLAKNGNRAPFLGVGGVDTFCTAVCKIIVTAPPRVGCVAGSKRHIMPSASMHCSDTSFES